MGHLLVERSQKGTTFGRDVTSPCGGEPVIEGCGVWPHSYKPSIRAASDVTPGMRTYGEDARRVSGRGKRQHHDLMLAAS